MSHIMYNSFKYFIFLVHNKTFVLKFNDVPYKYYKYKKYFIFIFLFFRTTFTKFYSQQLIISIRVNETKINKQSKNKYNANYM